MLVGAAFAVAGAIMQGVTRNPLADSGLLGINSGATFALALCLALLPGSIFPALCFYLFWELWGHGHCLRAHEPEAAKAGPGAPCAGGKRCEPVSFIFKPGDSMFYNIGYDLTFWTAGGVSGIRGASWSLRLL